MAGIRVRAAGDKEAVGGGYLPSSDALSFQQRCRLQIHSMEAHRSHTRWMSARLGNYLLFFCSISLHTKVLFGLTLD